MITYQASDINHQLAYNAHLGTSFVPDKRADDVIAGYMAEMAEMIETFTPFVTPENEAAIKAELERYRLGYIKYLSAMLSAESRTMSSMITGPSNFPVRSNQKRLETAHKRLEEFLGWRKLARERMDKTFNPRRLANAPVSSDDSDAVAKLQAKIEQAEKLQEMMKAANAIVRKKIADDEKVAQLVKLDGISEQTAWDLLKPDYMGQTGFANYQLTNNNANIRRMRERVVQLEKERERPQADDLKLDGVTISENTGLNRLQLFFDGKPPFEVRTKLKAHGFHWSPREGAWQRQLNEAARRAAERVLGQ